MTHAPDDTPAVYPPLAQETRAAVPTDCAAHHLLRSRYTLYAWSSSGTGPIQPLRSGRRLLWPVAELRRALGIAQEPAA